MQSRERLMSEHNHDQAKNQGYGIRCQPPPRFSYDSASHIFTPPRPCIAYKCMTKYVAHKDGCQTSSCANGPAAHWSWQVENIPLSLIKYLNNIIKGCSG